MIQMTEAALIQLRTIRPKPDSVLIIKVVGGGCSGLQYKMDWQDIDPAPDKLMQAEDLLVGTDSKSFLYLAGMTLDFSGGLNGKGFEFNNPNASRTCGCGTSFSV